MFIYVLGLLLSASVVYQCTTTKRTYVKVMVRVQFKFYIKNVFFQFNGLFNLIDSSSELSV